MDLMGGYGLALLMVEVCSSSTYEQVNCCSAGVGKRSVAHSQHTELQIQEFFCARGPLLRLVCLLFALARGCTTTNSGVASIFTLPSIAAVIALSSPCGPFLIRLLNKNRELNE